MGELGKLKRIVQRRDLKTQVKMYKQILTTHEPLVKAMEVTKRAFQEGMQAGFQKAIQELEQAEREKKQAVDLDNSKIVVPESIVADLGPIIPGEVVDPSTLTAAQAD
jgi:hypothetical protein